MITQDFTLSSTNEYYCLSTDAKPSGCPNGSVLFEMDTDKKYKYDEENNVWYIQTSG